MKPTQPLLPFDPRPQEITTESGGEFFALLDREDLVVVSAERDGNGMWRCRVRYLEPVSKLPTTPA